MDWINVKDEMPKTAENVLIYYSDGIVRIGSNYGGFSKVLGKNREWVTATHWMPMPACPRVHK